MGGIQSFLSSMYYNSVHEFVATAYKHKQIEKQT